MSRDATELLAFAVAKRLRAALSCRVLANESASGYGTICVTGHPIVERLWLQCTSDAPERELVEADRDAANMGPIWSEGQIPGGQPSLPRLPAVFHRRYRRHAPIDVTTRLWVLDDLRWHAQADASDDPRTELDTVLSRLNRGEVAVTIGLDTFVDIVMAATAVEAAVP